MGKATTPNDPLVLLAGAAEGKLKHPPNRLPEAQRPAQNATHGGSKGLPPKRQRLNRAPWLAAGRPTAKEPKLAELPADENGGRGGYICTWKGCTYQTVAGGHMKRHMRTHTGERPYTCSWPGCQYSASQSGHLVQHVRGHTGERPFKCEIPGCDYAATRSGHLKRHMRVHVEDEKAVPEDLSGTTHEAAHARAIARLRRPPVEPAVPDDPIESAKWRSSSWQQSTQVL